MAQSYPAHNRGAMFVWRFDSRVLIFELKRLISFKYKINTNTYIKIKTEAS